VPCPFAGDLFSSSDMNKISDLCAAHKKDRKFLKKVVDRPGKPALYSRHVDALLRRRGLRFLS
jgi:hypothetical protein